MTILSKTFIISLVAIVLGSSVYAQKTKKEVYIPMDYSTCGYRASERPIPDVSVSVYVKWQAGDCSSLLQQAIDHVSRQKANAQGQRGAILLGEGTFRIDQPLRIHTSGVVLRGMGRDKTIIEKHGVDRGATIYIEGKEENSK